MEAGSAAGGTKEAKSTQPLGALYSAVLCGTAAAVIGIEVGWPRVGAALGALVGACLGFQFNAVVMDHALGSGLIPAALSIPAAVALWGAHQESDAICGKPLKTWLFIDGIAGVIFAISGVYAMFVGGKEVTQANKGLCGPMLILLIIGTVWFFQTADSPIWLHLEEALPTASSVQQELQHFNKQKDYLKKANLLTEGLDFDAVFTNDVIPSSSKTSPDEMSAFELWFESLCSSDLRMWTGAVLLLTLVVPFSICNYVLSVVGGAGVIPGILSLPTICSIIVAVTEWNTECSRPLKWWLLIDGIIFFLLPAACSSCVGVPEARMNYALSKKKSKDSQTHFVEDAAVEEELSPVPHFINTCLCLPTLILFVLGAIFYFQSSDATCCRYYMKFEPVPEAEPQLELKMQSNLRWWTGIVLLTKLFAPIVGACCSGFWTGDITAFASEQQKNKLLEFEMVSSKDMTDQLPPLPPPPVPPAGPPGITASVVQPRTLMTADPRFPRGFAAAAAGSGMSPNHLFSMLDKDGSGALTKAELEQGLAAMQSGVVMR